MHTSSSCSSIVCEANSCLQLGSTPLHSVVSGSLHLPHESGLCAWPGSSSRSGSFSAPRSLSPHLGSIFPPALFSVVETRWADLPRCSQNVPSHLYTDADKIYKALLTACALAGPEGCPIASEGDTPSDVNDSIQDFIKTLHDAVRNNSSSVPVTSGQFRSEWYAYSAGNAWNLRPSYSQRACI